MKTFINIVFALATAAFAVLASLTLITAPVYAADDEQNPPSQLEAPFTLDELTAGSAQMKDGYFVTTGSAPDPVHLVHDLSERTSVRLDDTFRLMVSLQLPGDESPCSRRVEKECEFILRVIDAEGTVWENWRQQIQIGPTFATDLPGSISRKAAFGPAVAQFEFLSPEGETIFMYSFPLEIR